MYPPFDRSRCSPRPEASFVNYHSAPIVSEGSRRTGCANVVTALVDSTLGHWRDIVRIGERQFIRSCHSGREGFPKMLFSREKARSRRSALQPPLIIVIVQDTVAVPALIRIPSTGGEAFNSDRSLMECLRHAQCQPVRQTAGCVLSKCSGLIACTAETARPNNESRFEEIEGSERCSLQVSGLLFEQMPSHRPSSLIYIYNCRYPDLPRHIATSQLWWLEARARERSRPAVREGEGHLAILYLHRSPCPEPILYANEELN